MKLAGIILIIIGIVALCYQYIPIHETKQDAQIGPINIQHEETHNVPVPPIIGGVCIIGGIAALVLGGRRV